MISLLGLACGIILLLVGGTALVRGASGIASSLGVSPMIIGLTVVAFGTSAPELVVNVLGALEQETDIAFGNVVGSNIANLGLVLGLAGLIAPMSINSQLIAREVPLLLLTTAILTIMVLDAPIRGSEPYLDRADALILLLLFTIFLYVTVQDFMQQRRDPLLETVALFPAPAPTLDNRRSWWFAIGGIIGLTTGGEMTIRYGIDLAEHLQLSKVVVGIAFVAIGTSLPELVTSVIAAVKREPDLSVGNVIGSNLFNSLFVLPISGLIMPIQLPAGGQLDLVISFLLAAALIPVFIKGRARLDRPAATLFLLTFVVYLGYRISGG